MTDQIDAGQASEPVAAPEAQETPSETPSFEPTPMDSIDRAFAKLDEEGKAESEKSEPETEGEKPEGGDASRQRDEKGRFVSQEKTEEGDQPKEEQKTEPEKQGDPDKTETKFSDAPERFSPEAKEAWKDAPEAVRAEIHRAVTELQQGLEKYKGDASEWQNLSEFAELAQKHNTTVKDALNNYVNADTIMARDPIKGLEHICGMYGLSLNDVAAHITGQTPDQVQSQSEQTIRDLRNELGQLKQQLGGVESTFQQQTIAQKQREVEAFAAEHPRFEELQDAVLAEIKAGHDLHEAYRRAELLNPAPQPQTPPSPAVEQAPKPDPTAQTRKGNLSVSGAPSSGSNPANRKPPSSTDEAIDRAFASMGIG